MIALPLAIIGGVCFLVGAVLLRSIGPAYRVARLLGSAPEVSLDEAVAAARAADVPPRYVRAHGRITSDEEFPDDANRPLVFRRRRLERAAPRGAWHVLTDEREAVPFGIEDRKAFVAVDVDALGDGLVVVPREATGTLADLPAEITVDLPTPLDAAAPVRLRIEQVSAVEHATVCGVPVLSKAGEPTLTAGLGRPLILSVVEPDAAMRLLAAGRRRRVLVAGAMLVTGLGLLAMGIVAAVLGV